MLNNNSTNKLNHGSKSSGQYLLDARFGFDVERYDYHTRLIVYENLSRRYDQNNVDGTIAFVKGDFKQPHNFEVLVKARSTEEESLDCLEFNANEFSLSIRTSSTESTEHCSTSGSNVQVDIVIAVRPSSLQLGVIVTKIYTNFLSIIIWPEIEFQTNYMALRSIYGDVICYETFFFTARSITITSDHGLITGNWSLPVSIAFATIVGKIDVDLLPKLWSAGTSTRGALEAQSVSGDIHICMPFEEDKLSLRNSTTSIVTQYGSVATSLVHGAITNITTRFGTINATLLPYWAFDLWDGVQHNYITTSCISYNTILDVLDPIGDDYYKIRPLYFTRSRHDAAIGEMSPYYSREWAGTAEWKVEDGTASISGEDYEVVEDRGLRGKIQRLPRGSDMYAGLRTGTLFLTMKD